MARQTRYQKKKRMTRKKQRGGERTKENYVSYPLQFISGLIHGTTYEAAVKILRSGYLEPHPGLKHIMLNDIDTYVNKGVFLQALFGCSNKHPLQSLYGLFPVNFLFSNRLLTERNDWYLTNNWIGGIQFPPAEPRRIRKINGKEQDLYHTYSKTMITQFIDKYYDTFCSAEASPLIKNEVVFDGAVPLTFLKAIYIYDHPNLTFTSHKKVKLANGTNTVERTTFVNTEEPDTKCTNLKSVLAELGLSHIPVIKVKSTLPTANAVTVGNC